MRREGNKKRERTGSLPGRCIMLRRFWILVVGLTLSAMATMINYANWQRGFQTRALYSPTAIGVRSTESAGLSSGGAEAARRKKIDKKTRKYIRGHKLIPAQNTSSWGCSVQSNVSARSDRWQAVLDNATYVYSAYLDPRIPKSAVIRVFGIMSSDELVTASEMRHSYYCMISTQNNGVTVMTQASVILMGRHKASYLSVQFVCKYTTNVRRFPFKTLSIVTRDCTPPNNVITIVNTLQENPKTDFAVCLSGPLKHKYNDVQQFVEWMEINILLGAEMFFVYDYSIGDGLRPAITYYQARGMLKVIPWLIPISLSFDPISGHEFHTFATLWNYGQETLIPDCLYRNMYRTRYAVYLDLDELIVPRRRHTTTWKQMIDESGCDNRDTAVYIGRNVFFATNPAASGTMENRPEVAPYNNSKLLANWRERFIYKENDRSKYIVVPDKVLLPYIHKVFKIMPDTKQCVLLPDVGLLHHYKTTAETEPELEDNILDKYSKDIIRNTIRVFQQIHRQSF